MSDMSESQYTEAVAQVAVLARHHKESLGHFPGRLCPLENLSAEARALLDQLHDAERKVRICESSHTSVVVALPATSESPNARFDTSNVMPPHPNPPGSFGIGLLSRIELEHIHLRLLDRLQLAEEAIRASVKHIEGRCNCAYLERKPCQWYSLQTQALAALEEGKT